MKQPWVFKGMGDSGKNDIYTDNFNGLYLLTQELRELVV